MEFNCINLHIRPSNTTNNLHNTITRHRSNLAAPLNQSTIHHCSPPAFLFLYRPTNPLSSKRHHSPATHPHETIQTNFISLAHITYLNTQLNIPISPCLPSHSHLTHITHLNTCIIKINILFVNVVNTNTQQSTLSSI